MFLEDTETDLSELTGAALIGTIIGCIIVAAFCIFLLVCLAKCYKKAGCPGWGVIVPIYDNYLFVKIATGNGWKFLLMLIPVFGEIYAIILIFKFVKAFGHGFLFGLGTLFFPEIFIPILALGNSEYEG